MVVGSMVVLVAIVNILSLNSHSPFLKYLAVIIASGHKNIIHVVRVYPRLHKMTKLIPQQIMNMLALKKSGYGVPWKNSRKKLAIKSNTNKMTGIQILNNNICMCSMRYNDKKLQ